MVQTVVTKDGGIRKGTTMKKLAKLKTPFKRKGGSTTAGNCSQITDGCAVCFVARRSFAE